VCLQKKNDEQPPKVVMKEGEDEELSYEGIRDDKNRKKKDEQPPKVVMKEGEDEELSRTRKFQQIE